MKNQSILPPSFYAHDTVLMARELLGKIIVREVDGMRLSGRIIETEAYPGLIDPASHAYRGKTNRNASLFGPVAHAYVYFTYGMHYCLNLVSRSPDARAGGVLIRGLEPLEGIEQMCKNRGMKDVRQLTNGPGKLAEALAIDRKLDGISITKKGPLYVVDAPSVPLEKLVVAHRIGISKAQENPWRFYERDNKWVSKE